MPENIFSSRGLLAFANWSKFMPPAGAGICTLKLAAGVLPIIVGALQ